MGWGTVGNVTTDHLNSSADDPSQARVELYNALIELQAVINGRGSSSGVAPLDASTKIADTYLPNTITSDSGTNLTLQPATDLVVIEDIFSLTPKTTAELSLVTAGDGLVAYCSDGDGGAPCLAVCLNETDSNGTVWYKIALGAQISP